MTRHVFVTRSWPARYFSGLTSPRIKLVREKELLKRRRVKNPTLQKSDTYAKPRRSRWTLLFHKTYPGLKFNKNAISKRTGIPKKTLDTVYDRGLKAWKTGGSRPGATAQQWAIARVYKYVLVTKKKAQTTRIDPDSNLRRK